MNWQNEDESKAYYKNYYKSNKERLIAYKKKWRSKNSESLKIKMHEYYLKNKEAFRHRGLEWVSKNKETRAAHCKKSNDAPTHRFRIYKQGAERRKYEFKLSFNEFMSFWQKPCHYCGDEIKTIGLDRVDPEIGYVSSNVCPCCRECNFAKRASSKKKFIEMCRRVSSRFPYLKTGDVCTVLSS